MASYAWAVLDTHDCLTDFYKHKRTAEEIEECLRGLDLEDIDVRYDGNGVEARERSSGRGNRFVKAG